VTPTGPSLSAEAERPHLLQFDDNRLAPLLFGQHDSNLARLEQMLEVTIVSRGNRVAISGPAEQVQRAEAALKALWERLERGMEITTGDVDAAARLSEGGEAAGEDSGKGGSSALNNEEIGIRTRKKLVTPRSPRQVSYLEALRKHELVFALGPAGTGKTYLAVAMAVDYLLQGKVDRIVLSRPAVEAGERLGFLPGDLKEKVDPYLRPLYDALYDLLPGDQVDKRLETHEIEVAPLAFMRGRTLSNAYVILDEAQNTTPVQMKMFLTRMGENSRMAVTGDMTQVDLPRGQPSGLRDAVDTLAGMRGLSFVQFTDSDVVRHPLVTRIVKAYQAREDGAQQEENDLFESES
jgi:phosphate starvation-inducible PhoH-like protein